MSIDSFLNSSLPSTLATILAGLVVFVIYFKQKMDYKRDAALLILQEIRYAEQQIGNARSYSDSESYPLAGKLLPTNSWYKNIHLFINDFKQPQIDLISRFYAQVEYLDLVIEKISNYKTSIIEQSISDLSGRIIQKKDILPDRIYLSEIRDLLVSQKNLPPNETMQSGNYQQITSGVNSQQAQPTTVNILRNLQATSILKEVSSKVEFIFNTPTGEKFINIAGKKMLMFF